MPISAEEAVQRNAEYLKAELQICRKKHRIVKERDAKCLKQRN